MRSLSLEVPGRSSFVPADMPLNLTYEFYLGMGLPVASLRAPLIGKYKFLLWLLVCSTVLIFVWIEGDQWGIEPHQSLWTVYTVS